MTYSYTHIHALKCLWAWTKVHFKLLTTRYTYSYRWINTKINMHLNSSSSSNEPTETGCVYCAIGWANTYCLCRHIKYGAIHRTFFLSVSDEVELRLWSWDIWLWGKHMCSYNVGMIVITRSLTINSGMILLYNWSKIHTQYTYRCIFYS